jgi:hypothetical protein
VLASACAAKPISIEAGAEADVSIDDAAEPGKATSETEAGAGLANIADVEEEEADPDVTAVWLDDVIGMTGTVADEKGSWVEVIGAKVEGAAGTTWDGDRVCDGDNCDVEDEEEEEELKAEDEGKSRDLPFPGKGQAWVCSSMRNPERRSLMSRAVSGKDDKWTSERDKKEAGINVEAAGDKDPELPLLVDVELWWWRECVVVAAGKEMESIGRENEEEDEDDRDNDDASGSDVSAGAAEDTLEEGSW